MKNTVYNLWNIPTSVFVLNACNTFLRVSVIQRRVPPPQIIRFQILASRQIILQTDHSHSVCKVQVGLFHYVTTQATPERK
jgi:hypothetical protein